MGFPFDPGAATSGLVYNVLDYGADPAGVADSTAAIEEAITAALAGGVIYRPPGTFLTSGGLHITNSTGPIEFTGPGTLKLAAAAPAGTPMLKIVNSPNVSVTGPGTFDQNEANQANTVYGVYYDAASSNLAVHGVRFINLRGFACISSDPGNPPARTPGLKIYGNFFYGAASVNDICTIVADHGCSNENFVSGGSSVGLNIYESNETTCLGNEVQLNGLGGRGIAVMSSFGCPVTGNAISGSTNDYCIIAGQELDNASARVPTDCLISGNTLRWNGSGSAPQGIVISGGTISGISIAANVFDSTFLGVNYNYTTIISDVLVADNHFINIGGGGNFVLNSTPTGEVRRGNKGYNPAGPQTPPAVPGTTVALTNPFPFDCSVAVTDSGTGTSIAVGGITVASIAVGATVPVFVGAGQTITLTYTTAPTWAWTGR